MKPRALLVRGAPLRRLAKAGLSKVLPLVDSGLEKATAVKTCHLVGGRREEEGTNHGTLTKAGLRRTTLPAVVGRSTMEMQTNAGKKEAK